MRVIFLLLCILCFSSCKDELPKDILPQKKMQKVLWDVIKVDGYCKNFLGKDSSKNVVQLNSDMQAQVFALHKTTQDEFYKSYNYYLANQELMKTLLDSISNFATNEKYSQYSKPKVPNPQSKLNDTLQQ